MPRSTIALVTCEVNSEEIKEILIRTLGIKVTLYFWSELNSDECDNVLQKASIIISMNLPREISPEEYPKLTQLKFLQVISAGVDHVPFAKLPSGLKIASNAGAYAQPMAEHILAMILALAKHLLPQHQKLCNGEFDQQTLGLTLKGMTAAILGFGGIGKATANLLRCFGMKIFAINTSGKTEDLVDFIGTLNDLQFVLQSSDVIIITLPLTRFTKKLLNKDQLKWMKPMAILVNVSRGAIIDEEALYLHLKSHPDFLVGLDVWWSEPFLSREFKHLYPFLELPNVLGSPHNSGIVPGSRSNAIKLAAENVKRNIAGGYENVKGKIDISEYLPEKEAI